MGAVVQLAKPSRNLGAVPEGRTCRCVGKTFLRVQSERESSVCLGAGDLQASAKTDARRTHGARLDKRRNHAQAGTDRSKAGEILLVAFRSARNEAWR